MTQRSMSAIKTVLWVAGIILVVVILSALLFPKQMVEEKILAELNKQTGRAITVESVNGGMFPTPHIELEDIIIGPSSSGPDNRLSIKALDLKLRLLPLLRREVEITTVSITEPLVEIFLASDSTESNQVSGHKVSAPSRQTLQPKSVTDALDPQTRTDNSPADRPDRIKQSPNPTTPLDVTIKQLTISTGTVRVFDPAGDLFIELTNLDETLAIELTTAGQIRLAGETLIGSLIARLPAATLGQGLDLSLNKSLIYDLNTDYLEIEEASLLIGDLPVSVAGSISGIGEGAPRFDISLAGGPANVSSILAFLPADLFPEIEGIHSAGVLSLNASAKGCAEDDAPEFAVDLHLADGRIEHPLLDEPIIDINLDLSASPKLVAIKRFTASTKQSHLECRLGVTDYLADPQLDLLLDVDLDLTEASRLQANPDSLAVSGRLSGQLSLVGKSARPVDLTPKGMLNLEDIALSGLAVKSPVTDLAGEVSFDANVIDISELSCKVAGSDISLQGTVRDYSSLYLPLDNANPAKVDWRLSSHKLNLDALANDSASSPSPAKSTHATVTTSSKTSRGPVDEDHPETAPLSPLVLASSLALVTGQISLEVDELIVNRLLVRQASGRALLDQQVITCETFGLGAFGGDIKMNGQIDFQDPERPHFNFSTEVSEARASDLFSYASDLNRFGHLGDFLTGDLSITAEVSGDLNDTLGLDLETFSSSGNLITSSATISGHPLQTLLANYIERPALNTLAISDWLQPFQISDGRVQINGLNLQAGELSMTADGWQSISGDLAISLDLHLPGDWTHQLGSQIPPEIVPLLLADEKDRFVLPVIFSGTWQKPKVALNAERMQDFAKQQANRRLQTEREQLESKAIEQASEFLQDLIGSESDSAGQTPIDIEEEATGLLKKLFKK